MISVPADKQTSSVEEGCITVKFEFSVSSKEKLSFSEEPSPKKSRIVEEEKQEHRVQCPVSRSPTLGFVKKPPIKDEKVIGYFERVMCDYLKIPYTEMKLTDFIQLIGRHMDVKYTKETSFGNTTLISSEVRRKKTLQKCLVMEPYSKYYVYKVVNP